MYTAYVYIETSRTDKRLTKDLLGADFKNNQTTKQESRKEYCCFLAEYFIWTNRKQVQFCFYLPIAGPNKIVQQENNNIRDEILVSLFDCF